jgi:MFS family permease
MMASAGVVGTLAFFFDSLQDDISTFAHIVVAILFYSVLSAAETSLKSLASLNTPPSLVASAFGVLALLSGIGNILGNLVGTYLYSLSKTDSVLFFFRGARLPFLFVASLLLSAMFLVHCAKGHPNDKNRHLQ